MSACIIISFVNKAEHFNSNHALSKDKHQLNLKIISGANNYAEKKIKEAVGINKLKSSLNNYNGLELTN